MTPMTDNNIPVTEDELHAYVDGELPADRLEAVKDWLHAHPDAAAQVDGWRAMSEALHEKYDRVADEPVPPHLTIDALSRRPRRWAYAAIAATLAAFLIGGAAGYELRGARAQPTAFAAFTGDALDAHKLYVVDVRHPVEVTADQRAHLQQWLTNRCGYQVRAPELDDSGLKLVGGRLLPGPSGPAAFFMYETASGERYTIYASRDKVENTQMRFSAEGANGALYWAANNVGYVVTGPADKDKLTGVARLVYDQNQKTAL